MKNEVPWMMIQNRQFNSKEYKVKFIYEFIYKRRVKLLRERAGEILEAICFKEYLRGYRNVSQRMSMKMTTIHDSYFTFQFCHKFKSVNRGLFCSWEQSVPGNNLFLGTIFSQEQPVTPSVIRSKSCKNIENLLSDWLQFSKLLPCS